MLRHGKRIDSFFLSHLLYFSGLLQLGHSLAPPVAKRNAINVIYAGYPDRYPEYQAYLEEAFQEFRLDVSLSDNIHENPSEVDYIIYNPKGPLQDFSTYTNAKAVFNLQAGADAVTNNPTLSGSIPLTRMVDPGLREGMVEYVVGHVMRYHLSMDQLKEWAQGSILTPLARQRIVGILGLGELGGSCADALSSLNFRIYGWSRSKKEREGIHCFHGASGLDTVLSESDILVLLLPNTPETQNLINRHSLSKCKTSVCLINAGRGSSIDEDDLLVALDDGTVSGATLDVFKTEPLPSDHGFWRHPRVLVTPHIAAKSRAASASRVVAENIQRAENNQPLLYVVDRDNGY